MPNIANWISTDRAADAWTRISEKPSSIVIVRGNANLAAQTVRIEMNNTTNQVTGAGNTIVSVQRATIFGVRDHATVADTDIKKGDRFKWEEMIFRVLSVIPQTGEIQALCEVTS